VLPGSRTRPIGGYPTVTIATRTTIDVASNRLPAPISHVRRNVLARIGTTDEVHGREVERGMLLAERDDLGRTRVGVLLVMKPLTETPHAQLAWVQLQGQDQKAGDKTRQSRGLEPENRRPVSRGGVLLLDPRELQHWSRPPSILNSVHGRPIG